MADYQKCTKDAPMPKGDEGRWHHVDAVWVDDRYYEEGGGCDIFDCPHCGLRFRVELAQ